jgi:RNA polymerase sigma-70 factor, ECF subfamily
MGSQEYTAEVDAMLEPVTQVRSSTEAGGVHLRRTATAGVEPETLPDLLLIERSRAGDTRAIEALIRRYARRLFRLARAMLGEEERAEAAVCAAFVTAFADLNRYEPGAKFAAWLTRLTFTQAHAARAHARASSGRPAYTANLGATADEQPRAELERSVDALPEVFRVVFVLRVVEGVTGIETAASLALNQTTVRTRLYRALRRLSPQVLAGVRAMPALLAPSPECAERIVGRVLASLPHASMLSISASPP